MGRYAQCRFCLDSASTKDLISPCLCKGSGKYVHASCLLEWYKRQPEKGLECSVCKERLSRRILQPDESYVEFYQNVLRLGIYHPFFAIPIQHWVYYSVDFNIIPKTVSIYTTYAIYKALLNGYYLYIFVYWLLCVKNMTQYTQLWWKKQRWMIPCLYLAYTFASIKTHWVSGMLADVMLFQILMEHGEILRELNLRASFEFTNRPRRLRAS